MSAETSLGEGWRPRGGWLQAWASLAATMAGAHAVLNLGLAVGWPGQAWFFIPAAFVAAATAVLVWRRHPWARRVYAGLWLASLGQTFLTAPDDRAPLVAAVVLPTVVMLLVLAVRTVPRRHKRYVVPIVF